MLSKRKRRFSSSEEGRSTHPELSLSKAHARALRHRDCAGLTDPVAGAGFEPAKAEPVRLQRTPFDRSGTPPGPVRA
jgi:hypothetical protein